MFRTKVVITLLLFRVNSIHADDIQATDDPPPDFGTPEEFVKEINEMRSEFAKERNIPNMYKIVWSEEYVESIGIIFSTKNYIPRWTAGQRMFARHTYRKVKEDIVADIESSGREMSIEDVNYVGYLGHINLVHPLNQFIGCRPEKSFMTFGTLPCLVGFGKAVNFWYRKPSTAPASRCPPRFKSEDGLCVPEDPSKYTYWGTPEQLMEDVNYMRRQYAKEFGIPNMHQMTWNDSLAEILKPLGMNYKLESGSDDESYINYTDSKSSSWDGFGKTWRFTSIDTYSAGVTAIDESLHKRIVVGRLV